MFLRAFDIDDNSQVSDIVTRDYRTSAVFRKYGIEFCCAGRIPLKAACELNGIDKETIKQELNDAIRNIQIPNSLDFNSWDINFLIDYIRNIHHAYLTRHIPEIADLVERFADEHKKKYAWLPDLLRSFRELKKTILPHLEHEEQVIFPYIRQIAHAYRYREPYAALLVRTLRKPVEEMMDREHEEIASYLHRARLLTSNYAIPVNACVTHKVCFLKLRELDNDLVQHTHLENNILFPRAIEMEKELLQAES